MPHDGGEEVGRCEGAFDDPATQHGEDAGQEQDAENPLQRAQLGEVGCAGDPGENSGEASQAPAFRISSRFNGSG